MNRRMPKINEVVATFGSYSKPFLNMCLSNEEISPVWKMYFKSLSLSWKNRHSEALKLIEDAMDFSVDKTTYYFLLSRKLTLLLQLKDERGDRVYKKLSTEFELIPPIARKHVITTMLNYRAIRKIEGIEDFKRLRVWGKKYEEDKSILIFVLLGKARDRVKSGNISKSFSLFLEAFRIAKNIPHPIGIVDALNDMAWYMRMRHPYWACEMAKRAVYWAGWYSEDIANVFYTLDTLFECQRLSNDVNLYETACVILLTSEYLPKGDGRGTQGHYHDRIESCKHILPDFKISRYENNREIGEYLITYVNTISSAAKKCGITEKSISCILRTKTKEVRGETLRKLIVGLKIKPDVSSPFAIQNEYVKAAIEDEFHGSIGKIEKMNSEEREVYLISTYTAYLDRRKSLPYLSRKGKLKEAMGLLEDMKKFKEFMFKRYETMIFVNSMIQAHPFIQARKDLANEFLERMPRRTRERFIQGYLTLDEKEREVIDRFSRDYIRYDIRWGMRIKIPKEMERYAKSLRLKKTPAALAYWALDEERKRTKLVEVLGKFGMNK